MEVKLTLTTFLIVYITTPIAAENQDILVKFEIGNISYVGSAVLGGSNDSHLCCVLNFIQIVNRSYTSDPWIAKLNLIEKHNSKPLGVANYQNVSLAPIPDYRKIKNVDITTLNWVDVEIKDIDTHKGSVAIHMSFIFERKIQQFCRFHVQFNNYKYFGHAELFRDLGEVPFFVVRSIEGVTKASFLQFANDLSKAQPSDVSLGIDEAEKFQENTSAETYLYEEISFTCLAPGSPLRICFNKISSTEKTQFKTVAGNNIVSRVEIFGSVVVDRIASNANFNFSAPVGWRGLLSFHTFNTTGGAFDIVGHLMQYSELAILVRVDNLWWQVQREDTQGGKTKTPFIAKIDAVYFVKWVLKLTRDHNDFCGYATKANETEPMKPWFSVGIIKTPESSYINLQRTASTKTSLYPFLENESTLEQTERIQHAYVALQTTPEATFVYEKLNWYPIHINNMKQETELNVVFEYFEPKLLMVEVMVVESLRPTEGQLDANVSKAVLIHFAEVDRLLPLENNVAKESTEEVLLEFIDEVAFDMKGTLHESAKFKLFVRRQSDTRVYPWFRFVAFNKYFGIGKKLMGKCVSAKIMLWIQQVNLIIRYLIPATIDEIKGEITVESSAIASGFHISKSENVPLEKPVDWKTILEKEKKWEKYIFGFNRFSQSFDDESWPKIIIQEAKYPPMPSSQGSNGKVSKEKLVVKFTHVIQTA